jgi:hypothetical protein
MRYAGAIGKRFLWSYDDLAVKTDGTNRRTRARPTRAAK